MPSAQTGTPPDDTELLRLLLVRVEEDEAIRRRLPLSERGRGQPMRILDRATTFTWHDVYSNKNNHRDNMTHNIIKTIQTHAKTAQTNR